MSIENALVILGGETALAEMGEVDRLFFQEGAHDDDAYEFVPVRIRVASGGGKGFVNADTDDTIPSPLVGYAIDSVRVRAYYPEKLGGSKVPLCSSVGAKYGMFNLNADAEQLKAAEAFSPPHPAVSALVADQPVLDYYECESCPMSKFTSALDGRGQACKLKQRVLFLPEGWTQPVLLTLPTMSVSLWDRFCSGLVTQYRKRFYAFKIQFSVEKSMNKQGQPFGLVTPSLVGPIEDLAVARAVLEIQRAFRSHVRNMPVNVEFDDGGVTIDG